MESLPPLTDDDKATVLGLVLRYGVLRRENVLDAKEKEQIELRMKDRAKRMEQLTTAFRGFGFVAGEEGYFKQIRAQVGEEAYLAMLAKINAIIPDPDAVPPAVGPVVPTSEPEPEPQHDAHADSEPSIREMVIESLRKAFPMGRIASDIRRAIESRRKTKLHDKTIGMTLYRLSQAEPPMARREGTTWFFVPPDEEKKNPGAPTPGQNGVFD